MDIREFRVHGVGGSPGASMLGVPPEDTVVIQQGRRTRVIARAGDRRVEGYDWGRLTTDSPLQPLWVLLLPFTLINVAGWAHGEFSAGRLRLRATRWAVHVSAGLLTASFMLWTAIIGIDYLGYQTIGRIGGVAQVLGVVLGFALAAGVPTLLMTVANVTRRRFEQVEFGHGIGPRDGQARWSHGEDLSSPQFFAHDRSLKKLLRWHGLITLLTFAAVVLVVYVRWGEASLGVGRLFLLVGVLQIVVIAALAALCWNPSGRFPGVVGPRALPAAAVSLAVALSNGVCAGFAVLFARLAGVPWDRWGQELALIESFVITVVLWAVGLAVWIVRRRGRANADDLPARTTPEDQAPDGVTKQLRAEVARQRSRAAAAHQAPQLVTLFAGLFLLSAVVSVVLRVDVTEPVMGWVPPPERSLLSLAAAVLLPGIAVGAILLVWQSNRSVTLRRIVAMVWDVLTFWPRRYHPFAVRPFTERAVPELQGLIADRVQTDGGLTVSGHSQGSVLTFAALAPMSDAMLRRCGFLTYGSPITTLYGQAFPAYFGQRPVENLARRIAPGCGGWVNLYRLTDPIGGQVLGSGDSEVDCMVPDPAEATASNFPLEPEDPESLRPAWSDVAGHQDYERETAYKGAIHDFRARCSQL
ncbi:hypothetical protein [Nesterenkonia natronophila]|uniref:Integral membrane protein n=1 Tax=Nesterenkonia natronophila TaxID=2174932 RepID=A0A3A4F0K3_9MICC|nr:hypothetical protein [Nesterenkonia natronophila]RJN31416.1 hypothetical protein D3250_11345 [Nesterenkonia natronophila]